MQKYLFVVAPISVDVTNEVVALSKTGQSKLKYHNFKVELTS